MNQIQSRKNCLDFFDFESFLFEILYIIMIMWIICTLYLVPDRRQKLNDSIDGSFSYGNKEDVANHVDNPRIFAIQKHWRVISKRIWSSRYKILEYLCQDYKVSYILL